MKLYFYKLDDDSWNRKPSGISCIECEAEEKPKTYVPIGNDRFPNCIGRLLKTDVGNFISYNNNLIFYIEPSFEKAKEKFKNRAMTRVENAKKKLSKYENMLKVIEESEEKQNE